MSDKKLVPIVPTEEMIDAAFAATVWPDLNRATSSDLVNALRSNMVKEYKAMLAAAPDYGQASTGCWPVRAVTNAATGQTGLGVDRSNEGSSSASVAANIVQVLPLAPQSDTVTITTDISKEVFRGDCAGAHDEVVSADFARRQAAQLRAANERLAKLGATR